MRNMKMLSIDWHSNWNRNSAPIHRYATKHSNQYCSSHIGPRMCLIWKCNSSRLGSSTQLCLCRNLHGFSISIVFGKVFFHSVAEFECDSETWQSAKKHSTTNTDTNIHPHTHTYTGLHNDQRRFAYSPIILSAVTIACVDKASQTIFSDEFSCFSHWNCTTYIHWIPAHYQP